MTTDEKRQQKAMLLLEFAEAEEDLAHLLEKARRFKGQLTKLNELLALANSGTQEGMRQKLEIAALESAKLAADSGQNELAEVGTVSALIAEIDSAQRRINDLKVQKKSLGLK